MSETTTITLSKPVEHDGQTINTITVRAATLGDMLMADLVQGEQTKQAAIYASIAGVPLPAFRQLAPADYFKIVDAADALAGNGLAQAQEAPGATPQG